VAEQVDVRIKSAPGALVTGAGSPDSLRAGFYRSWY
jgi:hypothetical protein